MVQAAMRKCAMLALQGNLPALRLFLERTLGRVGEAPTGEPLDLAPPKLRTAAECSVALEKVAEAMCEGRVDAPTGKVLVDVISTQAKLLEVTDLEARLVELEKASATVDLPGNRRRS